MGAQVHDRIVPLNRALQNGDVVSIMKSKNAKPSWDWLRFTKTNEARRHIRSWFKRHDPSIAISDGKKSLNKQLARVNLSVDKLSREQTDTLLKTYSEKSLENLLSTISMGGIDPADVVRRLFPDAYRAPKKRSAKQAPQRDEPVGRLTIGGQIGLEHRLGKCCAPRNGQSVVGYITRAKGVTVHATSCANLKAADPERLLEAVWG
jgi:GTP pyrophosphokinase